MLYIYKIIVDIPSQSSSSSSDDSSDSEPELTQARNFFFVGFFAAWSASFINFLLLGSISKSFVFFRTNSFVKTSKSQKLLHHSGSKKGHKS